VSFIAEFVPDKKGEESATCNANGEPKDVDKGEYLMPVDVAEGDDEVIVQHGK